MLILGIDPGLANTGWALLDKDTARVVDAGYIATKRGGEVGDTQERLLALLTCLRRPMMEDADVVVVEWPGMGGARVAGKMNAIAASQTAAAAGAAVGMARGRTWRNVLTPAPITWRTALGCLRGQDEELHARLARVYPQTVARFKKTARPHVLDAIGLALYGRLSA